MPLRSNTSLTLLDPKNFNQSFVYDHSTIWVTEFDCPLTINLFFLSVLHLVILFGFSTFVSVFKIKACLNLSFIQLWWLLRTFLKSNSSFRSSCEIKACLINVSFLHRFRRFFFHFFILVSILIASVKKMENGCDCIRCKQNSCHF